MNKLIEKLGIDVNKPSKYDPEVKKLFDKKLDETRGVHEACDAVINELCLIYWEDMEALGKKGMELAKIKSDWMAMTERMREVRKRGVHPDIKQEAFERTTGILKNVQTHILLGNCFMNEDALYDVIDGLGELTTLVMKFYSENQARWREGDTDDRMC
jgi:hypothetical protein